MKTIFYADDQNRISPSPEEIASYFTVHTLKEATSNCVTQMDSVKILPKHIVGNSEFLPSTSSKARTAGPTKSTTKTKKKTTSAKSSKSEKSTRSHKYVNSIVIALMVHSNLKNQWLRFDNDVT